MDNDAVLERLLARLDETGPQGRAARDFLRARGVKVCLRPQPTGARDALREH